MTWNVGKKNLAQVEVGSSGEGMKNGKKTRKINKKCENNDERLWRLREYREKIYTNQLFISIESTIVQWKREKKIINNLKSLWSWGGCVCGRNEWELKTSTTTIVVGILGEPEP